MATLTVQTPLRADNQTEPEACANGGDDFVNTGKELLVFKNGSGSQMTLTIATQQTVDGEAVADKTIDVPAGETQLFGPWPTSIYNDSNAKVQLTYSDETSCTVLVIQPA